VLTNPPTIFSTKKKKTYSPYLFLDVIIPIVMKFSMHIFSHLIFLLDLNIYKNLLIKLKANLIYKTLIYNLYYFNISFQVKILLIYTTLYLILLIKIKMIEFKFVII